MKNTVCISFYLRHTTIRLHRSTIRGLNNPPFIRFLISDDCKTMIVQSYEKKDFRSVRLCANQKGKSDNSEIRSMGLCECVARINGWDFINSYRIYGKAIEHMGIAIFDFSSQEIIGERTSDDADCT